MIILHILWILIKILLIILACVLGLILLAVLILLYCPFGYEMAFSKPNPGITDLGNMRFSAHVTWLLGILRVGIVRTDDGMEKTLQVFGKYLMGGEKPQQEKEEEKSETSLKTPNETAVSKDAAEKEGPKKKLSDKTPADPKASKTKSSDQKLPDPKKTEKASGNPNPPREKKADPVKQRTEPKKREKAGDPKKETERNNEAAEKKRSAEKKNGAAGAEPKREPEKKKDKTKAQEIRTPSVTGKPAEEKKDAPKVTVKPKLEEKPDPEKKTEETQAELGKTEQKACEEQRNVIGRLYDAFFKVFEKIFAVMEKIQDTIEHFEDRVDKLEEKIGKLLHKIGWYKDFVMHECSKRLIRKFMKCLKKLCRHLLPRKMSGELYFSMEDPSMTGTILAVMGMTIPFHKNRILLHPGYEEKYMLSGEFHAKGRIFIGYILGTLLSAVLNRDMWNVFQRWRKKEGLNG